MFLLLLLFLLSLPLMLISDRCLCFIGCLYSKKKSGAMVFLDLLNGGACEKNLVPNHSRNSRAMHPSE